MKTPILFLCHRMPFPPNKGDKITTFNLLKYLAQRFDVYLGSFIDDPFDQQYVEHVKAMCADVKFVDITTKRYIVSGIKSIFAGQPVSISHYQSDELQQWVDDVIKNANIDYLFVYSSGMAQFIDDEKYASKKRVLDMADIDSDKWRQYKENKPFYSRAIYGREYRLLEGLEQRIVKEFDAVTLITNEERDLFRKMTPSTLKEKILTLSNGVDTDYFDPSGKFDFTDKPKVDAPAICFTGAMDYWANEDAVVWFVEKVWPLVRTEKPDLLFYIVGGKPSEKVKKLADVNGVVVTGRVVDVRPFIAQSSFAIATLRIARGVQNKVLEAMSMAKPVVMTSMAQEGIALPEPQQALVIDDEKHMARQIIDLLNDSARCQIIGEQNRTWIEQRYGWDGALSPLDNLYPRD